jgi:hypothetical protein
VHAEVAKKFACVGNRARRCKLVVRIVQHPLEDRK